MRAPAQLLLLGALVPAGHAAALMVGGGIVWPATPLRTRSIPSALLMSGGGDDSDTTPDDLDAFRAQLMRQFETADAPAGTDAMATPSSTPAAPSAPRVGRRHCTSPPVPPRTDAHRQSCASAWQVRQAPSPAAGMLLIANPSRFCSRNPFSRPVRDLDRFGLQGPIVDESLPADMKAQLLPVRASPIQPQTTSRGLPVLLPEVAPLPTAASGSRDVYRRAVKREVEPDRPSSGSAGCGMAGRV